jgi:SulP family sulfate permease
MLSHLSETNMWALVLTVATILITVLSKRITSKIPGSFFAIILITAAVALFKLPVSTIETIFGEIPNSISLSMPTIDWGNFSHYLLPAFTIAMLGAIESLLSAVVADGMISGNHRSNTELIAQGVANVITPIFGGIPATGAIARTATNVKNGGRTPVAGMVHAVTLLLIMLFFGKWAKLIPMPCLAGILIVVAYNMSEWRSFVDIMKGSRYDVAILLTTFFLTVLVDLTVAIEIGMVLAAMLFMERMSKQSQIVTVDSGSDDFENYSKIPKGINIYEISGPFFFAAAKTYRETLRGIGDSTKVLIIRMRHVPFIDSTGLHNFKATIHDLQARHIKIILSGVNDNVMKELEQSRLSIQLGKENICPSFDVAVKRAEEVLSELNSHKTNHLNANK